MATKYYCDNCGNEAVTYGFQRVEESVRLQPNNLLVTVVVQFTPKKDGDNKPPAGDICLVCRKKAALALFQ